MTLPGVFAAAVLLCGCTETPEPMRQLPPEQTTAKTSSTYTGTTVDFFYVSTSATPRRPTNELEMPDFPELDGDPFDDSFYELFTGEMGETAEISFPETDPLNIPQADMPELTDNFSETMPPAVSSEVRITEISETAVTDVPEETADTAAETVTVSSFPAERETTVGAESASVPQETPYESDRASVTFPSAESFDINDYMPSENDYPQFSLDMNGLFEP